MGNIGDARPGLIEAMVRRGPGTMLPKSDIDLEWRTARADLNTAMGHVPSPKNHISGAAPIAGRGEVTIGHLAHELNSLLDGSLRCLLMAQRAIGDASEGPGLGLDDAAAKLQRAHDGMRTMAKLLDRAMSSNSPELALFDEQMSLADQVSQIIDAVRPLAEEHRVSIAIDLTPRAATLNAATLGPVILNGLRNAIQACISSGSAEKRVELAIALSSPEHLLILISDTGPGVHETPENDEGSRHEGHGLGLDLCRQIVNSLGGDLSLTTVPFGPGAVLQVRIPVRRLAAHG